MACHRPYRSHVKERYTHANQNRYQLNPLGAGQAVCQRQTDEGVKAESDLRATGMVACIDPAFDEGQMRQSVSQANANRSRESAIANVRRLCELRMPARTSPW